MSKPDDTGVGLTSYTSHAYCARDDPGYEASPHQLGVTISAEDNKPKQEVAADVGVLGDAEEDSEDEADDDPDGDETRGLGVRIQAAATACWEAHRAAVSMVVMAMLLLGYAIYVCYALSYRFGDEGSIRLLWVTCSVVFVFLIKIIWHFVGDKVKAATVTQRERISANSVKISWVCLAVLVLLVVTIVLVDIIVVTKEYYNLVSGAGILVYILLLFIFSKSPAKVAWRTVLWGVGLQFIFALVILRWPAGYVAFEWLGDRVAEFLRMSDAGAKFVFGDAYLHHMFAFKVLPTVVFFSMVISVLYYLGVMQYIVLKIAWVMQIVMGTTSGESLNAAGNIFIGQTEAPLMIRPLLPYMTCSEIHAVMTGGFATIAGGSLGAFIAFGVPANHLLSASVMSAPAALAMSKLLYPETKKSRTRGADAKKYLGKTDDVNLIAAAGRGATMSAMLVANIAVNLIAFVAALEWVNVTLTWFGGRVGIQELTFQLICSYVLYPFAMVMGVELGYDCRKVAELIGVKTFLNEFIAFTSLHVLLDNKNVLLDHVAANRTYTWSGDDVILYNPLPGVSTDPSHTLLGGVLTERSEMIATYAMCGFANLGSIGVQMGALTAMAPKRRRAIASVALSAMIAGNVACFMTACIAGLFFKPGR